MARKGLNDNVLEIDRALSDHELIKVKVVTGDREAKRGLIRDICDHCSAQLIQSIGHIVTAIPQGRETQPKAVKLLRQ